MARYIEVEGTKCKVVESLGFVHDIGMRAVVVLHDGVERKAVGSRGQYRFWGARDRVQPLVDELERRARNLTAEHVPKFCIKRCGKMGHRSSADHPGRFLLLFQGGEAALLILLFPGGGWRLSG